MVFADIEVCRFPDGSCNQVAEPGEYQPLEDHGLCIRSAREEAKIVYPVNRGRSCEDGRENGCGNADPRPAEEVKIASPSKLWKRSWKRLWKRLWLKLQRPLTIVIIICMTQMKFEFSFTWLVFLK